MDRRILIARASDSVKLGAAAALPGGGDAATVLAMDSAESGIIVLAGERGSGKTWACREAARLAAARGLSAGGILCPSRRDASGRPLEVEAESLGSGERRLLASRERALDGPRWPPEGPGAFAFSDGAFAWALGELEAARSAELLILDEAGPVELRLGRGFRPFLDGLAASIKGSAPRPGLLVATARPSLASELAALLGPRARILELDAASRDELPLALAREAGRAKGEKRDGH
ncbi:MAG TPA: nucleoside-triphosphatase [Spirochaetales bacterium]|nr:nucleoside-triphosphatase [Spirochaetales bacterium]HRZ64804.1 nucleoside-triphosphatase [Spirochaetia bacterium]